MDSLRYFGNEAESGDINEIVPNDNFSEDVMQTDQFKTTSKASLVFCSPALGAKAR